MVSSRKTSALKSVSLNIQQHPPVTPSTKARHLTEELESKEKENASLQSTIADLTKILESLNIVTEKKSLEKGNDVVNKEKKDENMPLPAKTAYKIFCESVPKCEGADLRKIWKESSKEIRQKYTTMAELEKTRYQEELAKHNEEKKALEMYYEKKKQNTAMEFYDAHTTAQAALEKVEAGKKKGKKIKKDPDAPKRPISSYMYFTMEKREEAKKKNPDVPVTEISKILGEMWNISKGKKGKNGTKKYEDLASTDKDRYEVEKKAYDSLLIQRKVEAEHERFHQKEKEKEEAMQLMKALQEKESISLPKEVKSEKEEKGTKGKKKKKDPNAPKKNCSAYIFFCVDVRSDVKLKLPENCKQAEILSEMGRQWKEMTDNEKSKYVKMANKDKERYEKEMKKYNLQKESQ